MSQCKIHPPPPKKIFRFDDVCINSDIELHNQMTDWLFEKFPHCEVIWAVSPLVSSGAEPGRVFPRVWSAYSSWDIHCHYDTFGIPNIHPKVTRATHGLIHADHRFLPYEAQRMSIHLSARLIGASLFVPPFNKWNEDTERACGATRLIKFENGWRSMEHNLHTDKNWTCGEPGRSFPGQQWYLHAREWTMDKFINWFD